MSLLANSHDVSLVKNIIAAVQIRRNSFSMHLTRWIVQMCVCSNANPLHYYALWVLHRMDRWCWLWSTFNSRTTGTDHITCGTNICIVYCRKLRLGWLCSFLCSVGWWWEEGRRWKPVPAHSLLFSKSTKAATRLNVPIRQTNSYQQYYMPSQHIYGTVEGFGI